MMRWDDAMFMLYASTEDTITNANNCGLYFKMDSIDGLLQKLEGKANIIEIVDRTAYERKEITFHDCYGFQVTFSSDTD